MSEDFMCATCISDPAEMRNEFLSPGRGITDSYEPMWVLSSERSVNTHNH